MIQYVSKSLNQSSGQVNKFNAFSIESSKLRCVYYPEFRLLTHTFILTQFARTNSDGFSVIIAARCLWQK